MSGWRESLPKSDKRFQEGGCPLGTHACRHLHLRGFLQSAEPAICNSMAVSLFACMASEAIYQAGRIRSALPVTESTSA